MANDPAAEYERARDRLKKAENKGRISPRERDLIEEFIDAKDPERISVNDPEGDEFEKQTLATYADNLRIIIKKMDTPLAEAETVDVNEFMEEQLQRLSKSTVQLYQCAVVGFYRYHSFHVDPEQVVMVQTGETSVDEQDIFTREDIRDMRKAIQNDRDKAIFELLLNTGQRVRAIQSLRIKDIEPQEGVFYLNDEVQGLKGADKQSRKRPLLGARQACLDWLQKHPTPDDPEAAFITHLPNQEKRYGDRFGEPLTGQHINRRLRRIGNKADIDKPTNAHNFRHSFVTIAKRDYGLDDATIKFIIGHSADSNVMESTYSHLTADDHIDKAEVGAGIKEPSDESTLTPDICPTCYENLQPDSKACPSCGEVFTPDAKQAQNTIQDSVKESYKQTDPGDEGTMREIEVVEEALDDPETMNKLLENETVMDKLADRVAEKMADK